MKPVMQQLKRKLKSKVVCHEI